MGHLKILHSNMLSGERKVTVSTIKPVLHILKTKVLKVSDSDTNLTKKKDKIWDYLQNKYDDADIDELLDVCVYLDPRFKSTHIEDDVSAALVKDRLAREGIEIIEEQTCQHATGNTAVVTEAFEHTSMTSSVSSSNPSKKRKLSAWLKEAAEAQVPSNNPLTPDVKACTEIPLHLCK